MIRSLAIGVTTTVLVVLLPTAAAQAETPLCQGQPATIMGGTGKTIHGTSGDDVIVVPLTDAGVFAGAGNDLVCVVDPLGGGDSDQEVGLWKGILLMEGDDVLVNESSYVGEPLAIEPGEGSDVVIGGPGGEMIAFEADDEHPDTEADRYSLGAGEDMVFSGSFGVANSDDIDLGSGRDLLSFAGALGPGGRVEGGSGVDGLHLDLYDADAPAESSSGHLVVDNRIGTAALDGGPFLTWSGFELFNLESWGPTLEFIGGDQDEYVSVGQTVLSADLGAGDDLLAADNFRDGAALSGGTGRDQIRLAATTVRLDLGGLLESRFMATPHKRVATLAGFEDADVFGSSVEILGTAADERIKAWASRRLLVRGMGGDDDIRLRRSSWDGSRPPLHPRAWGGAGNDRLRGSGAADLLIGGPGQDVANGKAGVDRCDAETQWNCEQSSK